MVAGVNAIVVALARPALLCSRYIYQSGAPSPELIPARAVSLSVSLSMCAICAPARGSCVSCRCKVSWRSVL